MGELTDKEVREKEEVLSFLEDEVLHDGTISVDEFEDAAIATAYEQLEAQAVTHTAQEKLTEKKQRKPRKQARNKRPKRQVSEVSPQYEEDVEYEIESIVSHRLYRNSVVKYEIQWKGYPSEENTMEVAQTIHSDVRDLCAAYWDSLPDIPRPINAPLSNSNDEADPTVEADPTFENISPISRLTAPTAKLVAPSSELHVPKRVPKKVHSGKEETAAKAVSKKETSPRAVTKKEPSVKATSRREVSTSSKREPVTKKEDVPVVSRKRDKGETDESSQKKARYEVEHVPQYMLDKGFTFPTTWPNAKTQWNSDMQKFSAIQLSPVDKNIKMAYIEWKNGERTIHSLEECHHKCPEKLIEFYEERLRFV